MSSAEAVPLLALKGSMLQQLPGVGVYYSSEIHGVPQVLSHTVRPPSRKQAQHMLSASAACSITWRISHVWVLVKTGELFLLSHSQIRLGKTEISSGMDSGIE